MISGRLFRVLFCGGWVLATAAGIGRTITEVVWCAHTASLPVWWLRATAPVREGAFSRMIHKTKALDVHVWSIGRYSVTVKTNLACETIAS